MNYGEDYCSRIIASCGYTPADAPQTRDVLEDLFSDEMRGALAATHALLPLPPKQQICVITGLGINAAPHLGTLYVIRRALDLQRHGLFVQIILGDLDVRNARAGVRWSDTEDLVQRYRRFLTAIGFADDGVRGTITSQYENTRSMRNAFMLAGSVDESDFSDLEEDIFSLYRQTGAYRGLAFSVKQAMLLQLADFISPLLSGGYQKVLALSGLDEHRFASKADEVCQRYLGREGCVAGIFLKMIAGMNRCPKMSKSLPGSAISLDMTQAQLDDVRRQFAAYPPDSPLRACAAAIMAQDLCGRAPYEQMLLVFFSQLEHYAQMWRS